MSEQIENIGVVAAVFSDDLRAAARAARANGFRGLQLDAFSRAVDLTALSQTGLREVRQILASNEQTLIALRGDFGPKGVGRGVDVDRLLASLKKMLETAKALATPGVCLDVGALPEPANAPPPPAPIPSGLAGAIIIPSLSPPRAAVVPARPVDVAWISAVDSVFAEIASMADRIGVTIAVRSDLASFAAIARVLSVAACPWLGVDLDPAAILRDEWPIDEIFSQLGSMIRHVRARDAISGAGQRTRPALIGQGSTDWPSFLQALDASGYHGWLTVDSMEMEDRASAAVAGLKILRTSAP